MAISNWLIQSDFRAYSMLSCSAELSVVSFLMPCGEALNISKKVKPIVVQSEDRYG